MSPLPSAKPQAMRLSQSLSRPSSSSDSSSVKGDSTGAFSTRGSGSSLRSLDIDLSHGSGRRRANKPRHRTSRGETASRSSLSFPSSRKHGGGPQVSAEGEFIFRGSFNASDIDQIQIDPSTKQATSVNIGTLNIEVSALAHYSYLTSHTVHLLMCNNNNNMIINTVECGRHARKLICTSKE
jgi:hypothetical protein